MNELLNPHVKKVLNSMCIAVGTTIDKVDTSSKHWYETYMWTLEQQDEFIDWLSIELYKDKDLRKCFVHLRYRDTKARRVKAAKKFVYNYGWKMQLEK